MRRLTQARHESERGAIIPMVAVFCVVMVIMAALVIDIGALQNERRQLQNGADSAALGLAQYIASTCPTAGCVQTTLNAQAQALANANAGDGAATVAVDPPDYTKQRVTVKTSTLTSNGNTILPYQFGQAFSGSKGRTVNASATATWAGLKRAATIPLTISQCDYNAATTNNTVFNKPVVVYFHNNLSGNPCHSSSGADLPGGFGWLKDNNDSNPNDCNVTPSVNMTVPDDTGVPGTPGACDMSTVLNKDVLLAIYSSLTGTGSNAVYTIFGFGSFHLTGYRFASNNVGGTAGCTSPNTCISGYFIKFVGTGDYGGPNLGNRVALVS